MTIKVRTASGSMALGSIRVNDGVATRRAMSIKVRTGLAVGAINRVFIGVSPMTLTFDPPFVGGSRFNNSTVPASASVVVAGGQAPFSYAWSVTAFNGTNSPTFSNAAVANPTVTKTNVIVETQETATLRVVVTDANGSTATGTVEATFTNSSLS